MQAYNKDMYYSNQNNTSPVFTYSTSQKQDLQANNNQYNNNIMYYNNLNASPITPNTSLSTNGSFSMPLSTPNYYNYGYNSSPVNSQYYHYKPNAMPFEYPSQLNDVSTSFFPSNCYYTPASLSSSRESYSNKSTCDLNSYYKKVSFI